VLGDGGRECGGGRLACLCQLPPPVGLGGCVLFDRPGVVCAGSDELLLEAGCAAEDFAQSGRRCRLELLPPWGKQSLGERARVECRVGVGPPQRSERDDWLVTDTRLEQSV
jgi:hypothetical protein